MTRAMSESDRPVGDRGPRGAVAVWAPAVVVLAMIALSVPPWTAVGGAVGAAGGASADRASMAQQGVPTGQWRTFANGDDILSLALEGTTLWAGTRGGGLVRWDTASATAVQFLRPQDPIGGNTVYDIAVGPDGRKWLATSGGLTVLKDNGTADRSDDSWRTYTRRGTYNGLPSDDVRAVAIDGDRVWVGGVQRWDPTTEAWVEGGLGRLDTKGTDRTDDDVWAPLATFESTYQKSLDGTVRLGLVSDNINDIAVLPSGNLWIAASRHMRLEHPADPNAPRDWTDVHGGLSFVQTKGTVDTTDDTWSGLSCDDSQLTVKCPVGALAVDENGWVWAAVAGRGVIAFLGDQGPFTDEAWRVYNPFGTQAAFVQAIAFGPSGVTGMANTVWLATTTRGLAVVNHRGTIRSQSDDEWNLGRGAPFTTADGLTRNRVQALVFDGAKAWVGTGPAYGIPGGINSLSLSDLTFGAGLMLNRLPTNFITDMDFGAPGTRWDGHVWVATGSREDRYYGAGAVDLDTKGTRDPADDVWTRYTMKGTDPDGKAPWTGLRGDNVHAVAVQGDRVWFGSTEAWWNPTDSVYDDGGLTVFEGGSWTARTVANTGGTEAGLRFGSVSSLALGCQGEVWIGTGNPWENAGAGVDVLTPGASVHVLTQDHWAAYSYAQLASNNTTHIAIDCPSGQVWVAAAHHVTAPSGGSPGGAWVGGGVAYRDPASGAWTRYDTRNGLQSYKSEAVLAEAISVAVGPDGAAYVGTYGTTNMGSGDLVSMKPNWPAVCNSWDGSAWTNEVFNEAGWVSSIARDADGRLWVGTSRGGALWDSAPPERWQPDVSRGGLMVFDGTSWIRLDMSSTGIPTNDISVVKVSPEGYIWIGSEGWGMARFVPGDAAPTPTTTGDAPSPTITNTPTEMPTLTERPTATATRRGGTATRTPTRGTPGPPRDLYLPLLQRSQKVSFQVFVSLAEQVRRR